MSLVLSQHPLHQTVKYTYQKQESQLCDQHTYTLSDHATNVKEMYGSESEKAVAGKFSRLSLSFPQWLI